MRKWFFAGLFIAGFSLSGEKQGQTPFDRQGSYLGQPTPGAVPTIFALGIVSTGCHEMDIVMSPDLKEIYFTRSGLDWYSAIIKNRVGP